ncbi:MAG TPA: c-type cytochrome [Candidatus Obscuribacterales bacterium]
MLSKSQARMFFLTGTLLFSGVFLFLTIDSMASIPAQTKSQNISDEVKRGKHLFDRNNCMGCHTILGEGAYYAPELTKVYERRGPVWMKQFLKDPEAMYPGKRRMVNYHFSDAEIADLTAFFKWIGEMDLNGFPAKPDLKQAEPVKMASNGPAAPAMFSQICASCHSLGGAGGSVGPALDGVGTRRDAAWLSRWLADPPAVKPGTAMPKLPMSDAERAELVSFLSAQK